LTNEKKYEIFFETNDPKFEGRYWALFQQKFAGGFLILPCTKKREPKAPLKIPKGVKDF